LILYKQGRLTPSAGHAPISSVVGSPLQRVGYAGAPPPPPPPPARYVPASQAAMRPKKSGLDVLLLLLGVAAIAAIAGLIPLFVALYRAYTIVPDGQVPTPLPALLPGQVRMPDLVGLEQDQAASVLKEMGLALVVQGEEPHPTWPAFTVIRQSIPAGAGVDPASPVEVVLSQGPPLIEVPNVKGLTFEVAQERLTSLDLVAQKYDDWSPEPPGTVVTQDPPAGSLVANRTLITLMVSSGARVPLDANFDGQIMLKAYEIPRLQFKPGEVIGLTFFWQAVKPPTSNYNFFVYLTTPQGGIVSQIDAPPQGLEPTSRWPVNTVIFNQYQLLVPPSTAPGNYQVRVGFYKPETKGRLPILEPGRGELDNLGALILRAVQVVQ
jgi:hypothetical protein